MHRRNAELGPRVIVLAFAVATANAWTQPAPPPPASVAGPKPGGAVLAPLPAATHEGIEEIVVVGPRAYNLPDLGSSFRPPERPAGRLEVAVLPLYDPESPERTTDLFTYTTPENQRIHNIELFRVSFGRHEAGEP